MVDLIKESDNRSRGVTHLEEQRRQDAKRIAQLQQETAELLKMGEALSSKLQLLDDSSKRNAQRTGELKLLESKLRQEQRDFMEALQVNEQQRQRQMAEWGKEFEEQRQRMEEYAARFLRPAQQPDGQAEWREVSA